MIIDIYIYNIYIYIIYIYIYIYIFIYVYIYIHIYMTLCSCHVTYAFQSESTLHSYLNVKELLAPNSCDIWSLIDCNRTQTHSHLVRKQTLNHLAKICLNGWVFIYELSGCGFQSCCSHLNIALLFSKGSLTS